jgi:hypothetical protein
MKNTIANILNILGNKFIGLSSKIKNQPNIDKIKNQVNIDTLNVIGIETSKKDRCLSLLLSNNNLITYKDALQAIFNTLKTNDKFIIFGKNKIIYVTGIYENIEFALHSNVYINNDTTFNEYYDSIKDTEKGITDLTYLISNFHISAIPDFRVRI